MKIEPPDKEQIKAEHLQIARCLTKVTPVVLSLLESAFKDNQIQFKLVGKGLDMKYELQMGKMSSSFFLRNLLLEIATVDRDAEPLRYDYRCDSGEFLLNRVMGVIASKLAPLLPLMAGKDPNNIEKIAKKYHSNYERFNVTILDGKNMSEAMKKKIEEGHMP